MFYASLARFYGWTDKEIQQMPYARAKMYWKSINIVQAREYLVDMNITDYPRMKKEGRTKFHKDMRKQAYPTHMQKKIDFDEFAKQVGMLK